MQHRHTRLVAAQTRAHPPAAGSVSGRAAQRATESRAVARRRASQARP